MSKETMSAVLAIGQMLSNSRFDLQDEKVLQSQIEEVFKAKAVPYRRECSLSKESIIDFLVENVGVEVKINGNAKDIFRQCQRYCEFGEVQALILVTNKTIQLPRYINNKFTYVLNLGTAWL